MHTSIHSEFTGITRHSPRNGFNGFLRALPGDRACLPPSPAELSSANLTPASGRQDHTTSPSARGALVRSVPCVHRIPPRVRDDREPPLGWDGMAGNMELIWDQAQLHGAAARWHDGQISLRAGKRVKGWLSFPAQAQSACRRERRAISRLAGTTEMVCSRFKQPVRLHYRHCERSQAIHLLSWRGSGLLRLRSQ